MVEILNRVDRATEKKIIESLEDRDSDLAEQVKKLLFVFEDIVQLDDRYVQIVLREVDTHDLAMALKGATDTLYRKIEHNISKRAADNLKEEIELLGACADQGCRGCSAEDRIDHPCPGRPGADHCFQGGEDSQLIV